MAGAARQVSLGMGTGGQPPQPARVMSQLLTCLLLSYSQAGLDWEVNQTKSAGWRADLNEIYPNIWRDMQTANARGTYWKASRLSMKEAITQQHHQVPQTLVVSEMSGSLHIAQSHSHDLRYEKEPVLHSVVLHGRRSIFHPSFLKRRLNLKMEAKKKLDRSSGKCFASTSLDYSYK